MKYLGVLFVALIASSVNATMLVIDDFNTNQAVVYLGQPPIQIQSPIQAPTAGEAWSNRSLSGPTFGGAPPSAPLSDRTPPRIEASNGKYYATRYAGVGTGVNGFFSTTWTFPPLNDFGDGINGYIELEFDTYDSNAYIEFSINNIFRNIINLTPSNRYYFTNVGLSSLAQGGTLTMILADRFRGFNLIINKLTLFADVPEPSSIALFSLGLLGLTGVARRRKR
jgi:PEP-CTERM motif